MNRLGLFLLISVISSQALARDCYDTFLRKLASPQEVRVALGSADYNGSQVISAIRSKNTSHPEVIRMFSSERNGLLIPQYLENQIDAANYFLKVIEEKGSSVEIAPFLSEMHRLVAAGKSGKNGYDRSFHAFTFNSAEFAPGVFRHEFKDWLEIHPIEGVSAFLFDQPHLTVRASQGPSEKIAIERSNQIMEELLPLKRGVKRTRKTEGLENAKINGFASRRSMPEISAENQSPFPEGVFSDHISTSYPPAKAVPEFLHQMQIHLNQAIELALDPKTKQNRKQFHLLIRSTARFYQYGMVGHPFPRINNSIIAGISNLLLVLVDIPPQFHRRYDVYALTLPYSEFPRIISQEILRDSNL